MANKQYSIHQSPFYKLKSKTKLINLLRIKENGLLELQSDKFFRVFVDDGREIQEPKGKLRRVHDLLQMYFSRILAPAYLFSGVKGKSTIQNAAQHVSCNYMLTTDISGFFKNSKKEYVKCMFLHDFHAEPDVAYILSEIICYKDIIPTGSPLSQSIAFWSHLRLFDIVDRMSNERNIEFTLYVDDMTFSSRSKIPISFVSKLKKILANHSLEIKNKKTVHSYGNDYKNVTGCIVTPRNELKVHNRHKKKAILLLGSLDEPGKLKSLEGLISYCQSIEPTIFEQTKKRLNNTNIGI